METIVIITLIISLICLFALLMAISQLIETALMKGHCQDGTGMLWFIGIFASPIVLGLYTASLPDRGAPAATTAVAPEDPRDELPAI